MKRDVRGGKEKAENDFFLSARMQEFLLYMRLEHLASLYTSLAVAKKMKNSPSETLYPPPFEIT
jgi:hypothetical protein